MERASSESAWIEDEGAELEYQAELEVGGGLLCKYVAYLMILLQKMSDTSLNADNHGELVRALILSSSASEEVEEADPELHELMSHTESTKMEMKVSFNLQDDLVWKTDWI